MKPAGTAVYKHADPTHMSFGRSADSALLAKRRRGYDEGGTVEDVGGATVEGGTSFGSAGGDGSGGMAVGSGKPFVPPTQTGPCPGGRIRDRSGDCVLPVQNNG